jgi:hypothetical protein
MEQTDTMVNPDELTRLKRTAWGIGGLLFLLPIVLAIAVAVLTPKDRINTGFTDATAAITFITAAAVAIERVLEAFWGLVNMKSPWWPMSAVTAAVGAFEGQANDALKDPLATLDGDLQAAVAGATARGKDATKAAESLARYREAAADAKRRASVLQAMAPGNERLSLTTGWVQSAADAAAEVFQKSGATVSEAGVVLGKAAAYAGSATDLVAAFRENPARRILSLSLGTAIGLVISGLFGLNIFVAAANAPVQDTQTPPTAQTGSIRLVADTVPVLDKPTLLDGVGGVVLTGLIIGLGSGPTHEVIRLVQESKRNRRQLLTVGPTTDGASGDPKTGDPTMLALPTSLRTIPEAPAGGPEVVLADALPEPDAMPQPGAAAAPGPAVAPAATPGPGVVVEHNDLTRQMRRPTRLTSTE